MQVSGSGVGSRLCSIALLACAVTATGANAATARSPHSCAELPAPDGVVFTDRNAWVDGPDLPRFCRVRGTIENRVQFEMRLPSDWSGRFLMAGCGGFCGSLLPDKPGHSNGINEALKRGYAAISHDGGHQAESWETHWAADREALELWAHRILPVVATVGVELATSLYGAPPRYKYYSGCSNGGRLGLQAAQRYPELFDGIAAGGSIFDLSGIAGLWGNWLIVNSLDGENSRFPQSKVSLIKHLVMSRCDAMDGQADGIIDDPRQCRVDFSEAGCGLDDRRQQNCLTRSEASLLNDLYGGVRNGKGEVVYPSVPFGSEHYSDRWLFGSDGQPAWGIRASAGYRQLLALDLSEQDRPAGLSTDELLDWVKRSSVPAITDATDTDLSGLREADTKLLIYHGWSDPLIIPEPITRYYRQAAEAAGGLERLQQHARLFMVPGWGHCWEKPAEAPDQFDPLSALERWVENEESPQFLEVSQIDEAGDNRRSRAVCSYPAVARLKTGGNPDNYLSYTCVTGEFEKAEILNR